MEQRQLNKPLVAVVLQPRKNADHCTLIPRGGLRHRLAGRMHFVGGDQRHGYAKRIIGDCPESAYLAAGWKLGEVLGGQSKAK